MRSLRKSVLVILLAGFAAFPAAAQQQGDQAAALSEAQIRHAIQLALRNIHKWDCGEVKCEKATAEEVQNPPISLDQARKAIDTGVLSGTAHWCGLDWKTGLFLPMMDRFAKENNPGERQKALMALLHGIYQGQVYVNLQPQGACPDEIKKRIGERMASR